MAEASREFNWSLPMPTIAKIWRDGCIIRSQFLDDISLHQDAGCTQSDRDAGLVGHGQGIDSGASKSAAADFELI
jgi:6-phosphogluconate dehydrogenase (decarboxylating)